MSWKKIINAFMLLIGFGDRISPAKYETLSSFKNVRNFIADEHIISLGNKNIQKGPANIIVDRFDFSEIKHLKIEDDFIFIDNIMLRIKKNAIYDSELKISEVEFQALLEQLGTLEEFLIWESTPKSLVFLLDKKRERNFKSGFERCFMENMKKGFEKIISGNIISGIELMKGKGFGLTPSGDDFICGLLYGLFVYQIVNEIDNSELRKKIYQKTISDNLLSDNFLKFAFKGRFYEHFKNYLEFNQVIDLERVIATGETSGADMMTGFVTAIRIFNADLYDIL